MHGHHNEVIIGRITTPLILVVPLARSSPTRTGESPDQMQDRMAYTLQPHPEAYHNGRQQNDGQKNRQS